MSNQPSGTVTFLFTDIEGSTKRWERQPEAMAKAVARHDQLMRAAILEHHGHVFKTIGDAFCAVFPSAEDAVAATLAAQRAIADEPWGEIGSIRVRMALHTGEAEERDADYFGPPVNRTARLVSAGHGGQMLVSSVTGEHVTDQLPDGVRLRSLGKHRLKDLARPERILQLIANGLPTDFPRLKTTPSPTTGLIAALVSTLLALISFRVGNRSSSEELSPALLSPLSLYTGLKGLVLELSTVHEYVLLAVGGLLLFLTIAIAIARWRAVRRQLALRGKEPRRFSGWLINQRTAAFFGVLSLIVLGAYAYQQYLWRVALPIPDDALGIAMTREASAATVQDQLADSLYTQGQAEQVIVRQLPVKFDARDTDKARAMGDRIGAKAVIIYRADETGTEGQIQYVAYVVFTEPSIGLMIGSTPDVTIGGSTSATKQTVVVAEGVPVPVLQTESLDELINAAAGIIAYNEQRARKAIEHLELAMPVTPEAPNTGIVSFYLGNAYSLDNQPELAAVAYERAAAFYEQRLAAGEILGPQDQLILVKTYMERGRIASFTSDWDTALSWYERGLGPRAEVLARADGLEQPTDVHATYARLYTLLADAYRFQGLSEDQRSWEQRARDEIDALVAMAEPTDLYALVQQSSSRFFLGDCVGAGTALEDAIELDPADVQALTNAGIVALFQGRSDLAQEYWLQIIQHHPNDVAARETIANALVLSALADGYTEPAYLLEAEAYYREIISLDPTSIHAHRELADVTSLRADSIIIDSTALLANDMTTVAKSQREWKLDPDRRLAVLDAYTVIIDESRLLASELQPGNPTAEVGVAESYLQRQKLLYSIVLDLTLSGEENPESGTMGQQILADATQIREWSDRVLANPSASRLDRVRAWAARLESSEREWSWFAFIEVDETKAAELESQHRQYLSDAIALIEAEPVTEIDEISPMRIIYFKALFVAQALDEDATAAATYNGKIDDLTQRELEERNEGITHYSTFCTEVREREAGDVLLADGDVDRAVAHFDLALAANPAHIDSLRSYSAALFQQEDVAGAIVKATAATETAPRLSGAWADLGLYQLTAGDFAASQAAYDRFLGLAGQMPAQQRMTVIGDAIEQLGILLEDHPEHAPGVIEIVPRFNQFLDTMTPEEFASYQYPALYAQLGKLALYADQPAMAEPLLRRSLELDPHQPATHANLVISILAQEKDATSQIAASLAEMEDPYWSRIIGYEDPTQHLTRMEGEVSSYVDRFPDRQATMEPFTTAIEAAKEGQAGTPVGNRFAVREPDNG